jgi:hypothetical protein
VEHSAACQDASLDIYSQLDIVAERFKHSIQLLSGSMGAQQMDQLILYNSVLYIVSQPCSL